MENRVLFLRHWGSVAGTRGLLLDPDRGTVTAGGDVDGSLDGFYRWFGIPGRRTLWALYRDGDGIRLRIGGSCWDTLDGRVRVELDWPRFGVARFRIRVDGRIDHESRRSYPFRSLIARIDPTYDAIEYETDFFEAFIEVACVQRDWLAG